MTDSAPVSSVSEPAGPSIHPWLLPGMALGLGLLANVFFYEQPLGISLPLFTLAGLLALFGAARIGEVNPAWRNAWLAALSLVFAFMAALRADPFSTFLNLAAGMTALLLLTHTFSGLHLLLFSWADYLAAGLVSGIEIILLRPFPALGRALRSEVVSSPRLAAVLRGLLLALPVVLFFTALLSWADAAFQEGAQNFFRWLKLENLPEFLGHLFFITGIAWLGLGGLSYALRKLAPARSEAAGELSGGAIGFTEAAMVLGSVDALFIAFVTVQFRYFFGGRSQIVAGLTYAEYARRGFAELVVVAIFSLGLALLLQRLTRRQSRQTRVGFEVLAALLAVLTGVILASAFQRLVLYEQAYGFTQLRTYSHVFMIWLGVLLAVFLVCLHFNRTRLFTFGVLLAAFGFVLTLDVLNVDAFIVRQNLARYAAGGELGVQNGSRLASLDGVYLATLSDDAVPALLAALPQLGDEERRLIGGALHYRLDELAESEKDAAWWTWHFGRSRAYRLLEAARAELEKYAPKQYFWQFPLE